MRPYVAASLCFVASAGCALVSEPLAPSKYGANGRVMLGDSVLVLPPSHGGGNSPLDEDPLLLLSAPELPRRTVDTRMPPVTGRTIQVHAGDNLQQALNAANRGDEVVI